MNTQPDMLDQQADDHPEMQAHASGVLAHILACIDKRGGWLPFDAYMHEALYAPGLGYYVAGKRKLGEAGDFITAPELGKLFGQCIARQCEEVLAETGGRVLELGAGSGALAVTIMRALAEMGSLPECYEILEVSPDLREVQQRRISTELGELASRVRWLDALPDAPLDGVILANEVLDAMPVKRFRYHSDATISEWGVSSEAGRLALVERAATPQVCEQVQGERQAQPWSPGYDSELHPQAEAWVASLATALGKGAILLVDYGFPRHEYYHPDRKEGTLMCHTRHHAHDDALHLPGLQDITAHVNFTGIAEAALEAGLTLNGFTHQAAFLTNLGVLERVPPDCSPEERLRLSNEIKRLLMPHEMGELFKVMALSKGLGAEYALSGFSAYDQRDRLGIMQTGDH